MTKIKSKELWNLDITIAKFIYPRLVIFRKENIECYPGNLKSYKQWEEILDEMIWTFQAIQTINNCDENENKRINKGLKLFAKYFRSLWL